MHKEQSSGEPHKGGGMEWTGLHLPKHFGKQSMTRTVKVQSQKHTHKRKDARVINRVKGCREIKNRKGTDFVVVQSC